MKRLLFVCSANKLRSPTAEHIFSTWPDVETDSAGLNASAEQQLSTEQVEWADIIFVMEKAHRNKLSTKFRKYLKGKHVITYYFKKTTPLLYFSSYGYFGRRTLCC